MRGKNIGVIDLQNKRKHRLKTLGVSGDFETMSERIRLEEAMNRQQEKASEGTQSTTEAETGERAAQAQQSDDIEVKAEEVRTKHQEEIEGIRRGQTSDGQKAGKEKKE